MCDTSTLGRIQNPKGQKKTKVILNLGFRVLHIRLRERERERERERGTSLAMGEAKGKERQI